MWGLKLEQPLLIAIVIPDIANREGEFGLNPQKQLVSFENKTIWKSYQRVDK